MEFTQGVRFDSLGLLPEMTRALEKKNIEWSTPVQAGCIPPMREGKDELRSAQKPTSSCRYPVPQVRSHKGRRWR